MNTDIIAGKWMQLKGKAQSKWGDLTDDVFDEAKGDSKYLAGKLQEKYGWDRERADREVSDFSKTLSRHRRLVFYPPWRSRRRRDRRLHHRIDQGGSVTKPLGNARGACTTGHCRVRAYGPMPSASRRSGVS